MTFEYKVHLVTQDEYHGAGLGTIFRDGVVVDGLGGLNDDMLIVTAHSTSGDFIVYDEGHDFTSKEIDEWGR